jgi:RNA polymerase sigma-70 factor (ECF subfamily)
MNDASAPDSELVRGARAGSEADLRALIERHEPVVRAHLDRRTPASLRRKVATDDLLQEVWLVVTARLSRFEDRGEGAFRAWALGIADLKLREAARMYLGTRKRADVREVSRGERPDTAAFTDARPSPSQEAQGHELEEAAARALAALPGDYREILRLVQVEGFTLRSAAERMGRSHEAAKKLYGRALAQFAKDLGAAKQ